MHILKDQPQHQGDPSICTSKLLGARTYIDRRTTGFGDKYTADMLGQRPQEEWEEHIGTNVGEPFVESVSVYETLCTVAHFVVKISSSRLP